MGWLEALVLGIVQGLTEFLPISSSAHQSIVGQFFGGEDVGAAFTAITQLGTETAVILYFRKDIWLIIKNWSLALAGRIPRDDPQARMGWLVIIGSVPPCVARPGRLGVRATIFAERSGIERDPTPDARRRADRRRAWPDGPRRGGQRRPSCPRP